MRVTRTDDDTQVLSPYFRLKEAAAYADLDQSTFHTKAKNGNLPRHGAARVVLYRVDQIDLWIENAFMFPGREPAEPPRPKAGTRRRAATGEGIYDPGLKKAYGGTVSSNR